jgi:hypothetical protein
MTSKFLLPQKISSYIRRLEIMYRNHEHKILHEIISTASVFVREEVTYDNWNGGTTGHAVVLFVDEKILEKIKSFSTQKEITEEIHSDFSECARSLDGEYIAAVSLELLDENDLECKQSINPFIQPIINPDSLNIWKPGFIRLFISHRDEYKTQASELAVALEAYGISSFVAHDNIAPMEEWQHVIRKAMQSMEVLLAFITDDLFESVWTNQEIGFAIGKGIPIIPLKLERTDPQGFINGLQALKGDIKAPAGSLDGVYQILSEKLRQEDRLRKAAIQAFITSANFDDAKIRFNRLKKLTTLTESDIQQIIDGFAENESLYNAYYLVNTHNRLINFLENRTGKQYKIEEGAIKQTLMEDNDDEIPF